MLEQGGAWDSHLSLIEFTYNNSYRSSIGMTPFEALYGRRCRTPLCWFESGESVVLGMDVILGMNWLEYNHVLINCFTKTVRFSSTEEESGAEFLSTKEMKWLGQDGVLMFSLLAYLSVENQAVIDGLPVVKEFPEVFPDEIPDVPPEREVEFSIDLVPGTKPVSMAPYRMSASELAELKKQLEDLLDKKL